uniref:Na+/H+ antiporter n=1 Tax=uncultured bacterium esnapd7 TaxID=1366614 RepID=S5TU99_9BACT|nr:Na+/H+ antiporter [uncultured bacterium esnapd7]
MTTHQVLFLLLDLAVIVALARLLAMLAAKLDQPPVIGEVLAGILLGPTLFGESFSAALFPMDVRPFLAALANVGVAVFMFVVGLGLERTLLKGRGRIALTVSVSSIVLPFALGTGLAFLLIENHDPPHRLGFVLFIGAAMAVTAFPVLARILADRGMLRTALGGLALTCAAIDDVLAWSLLAVVVMVSGGGDQWLIGLVPLYVAVMFLVVRPLLRRLFAAHGTGLTTGRLAVVLAGLLTSGAATEWIGLHFIFGAFLFGVVMPRDDTEALRGALIERVGEFNGALLLPVFFIVAGLKVNLSGIGTTGLVELALVLLVAVGGKFGGAFAGARLRRLPARTSAALATLMNCRGLTELIILTVGLQLGVLDRSLYSIMVVMAVVTTMMTGPLLRLIHPKPLVENDYEVPAVRGVRGPVATR